MNHEEIRASLEAFALGALDETERIEVAAHVATCDECRAELAAFERVASAFPAALAIAAPVPPSDVARQRIRRAIRTRSLRDRVMTVVAAAAVVLLGIAVAWVWRSERTLADERERSEQLIDDAAIVFEVLDAPERIKIPLRPLVDDANWYGKVFTRPDMPFVVVMANRLPELDRGHEYHVWLTMPDGTTVLAGVLVPNDDGFAPLVYTADNPGPEIASARVTDEPAGATSPDGEVVLSSDVD